MKVLVVGGGGREHALVWKLGQSPLVEKIYCAPGNAGIAREAECVPIDPTDISSLADFAREKKVGLTVCGPEQPLAEGLVDHFALNGLKAFGPARRAARIEGSKAFAKDLMSRYGIPTARFDVFTEPASALKFAGKLGYPVVVKADGLAAGKGAVVCRTREEAERALDAMLVERKFGRAGDQVVVEEFLEGDELSVLALVSGNDIALLPPSQDHKQVFDGDEGPNTGGMGAYSPVPFVRDSDLAVIERDIIVQTVHALDREGSPYSGVLYTGLMLTQKGPYVLEFNCRFGDPETQAVLPKLEGDLAALLLAVTEGDLSDAADELKVDPRYSVCVIMASGGYPGPYKKGLPIKGAEDDFGPDVYVFHAGTRRRGEEILTAGGRVLGVTALGASLAEARAKAYSAVSRIEFEGAHYRTDIGRRGRKR